MKMHGYVQRLIRLIATKATKPKEFDISTIRARWDAFLGSYTYNKVKRHHHYACYNLDGRSAQSQTLVLPYWQQALTMACYIATFLEDEVSSLDLDMRSVGEIEDLRSEIWETLAFLIRGTHLIQHGHPLIEMTKFSGSEFLLHAAAGALSTCTLNQHHDFFAIGVDDMSSTANASLNIFHQVLDRHTEQLGQVGPVLGRLPLHVAAANIPPSMNDLNMSSGTISSGATSEDVSNCSLEILEAIVSKSAASAAAVKDDTGLYPLQLATANGFPWTAGLEALFQMAPGVIDGSLAPPLLIRVADKASLTTLFLLLQSAPQMLEHSLFDGVDNIVFPVDSSEPPLLPGISMVFDVTTTS
jgi:hypothetical protein